MPPTAPNSSDESAPNTTTRNIKAQANRIRNLFSIPGPIKAVFDAVPIVVYSPNELPNRAPKPSRRPSLYVFAKAEDARRGMPSFNPGCLKWQTFLRIAGIEHDLVSSNNHASPTGVLPFLLPALQGTANTESPAPIPSNKLLKYARDHGSKVDQPLNTRYEAYKSLLDHRIRSAWLYNLYLSPSNSAHVATPLYIIPTSSNPLIHATISRQLRAAAEAELLKYSSVIDVNDLYCEAEKAFEALSILLGDHQWFFPGNDVNGDEEPGLFDAEVFAYTHLLLDERMGWKEKGLSRSVRRWNNLVEHRERVLERYWGTRL